MATTTPGPKPQVTLCVPVPPEGAGLSALLEAIAAQSVDGYLVALSLDGPDQAAEAACKEAAAADPRVSYTRRPDPVGRLGNLNHLLFHAETEFACLLPAGCVPDAGYLESLVAAMDDAPAAALALDGAGTEAAVTTSPTPVQRLLAVIGTVDGGTTLSGLIRTRALAGAGRLTDNPGGGAGAEATFIAQLAREGGVIRAACATVRPAPGASNPKPAAQPPEAWWQHCADVADVALQVPGSVQDMRLLWLAVVSRLLSADLARPVLDRPALNAGMRDALVEGFMGRMESGEKTDLAFVLDGDRERIRRWTRGFCWNPRDKDEITDFGPQPVNAGQPFNAQPDGQSAVWIKTEGRLAPGTQLRLADKVLETKIELNTATAVVPPDLTAQSGEYPLVLVDADGVARSNKVTFWVLRGTAFGRSMVRMLRRMRGLPDPASRPALPPPPKRS